MDRFLNKTTLALCISVLFLCSANLYAEDLTADEIINTLTKTMNPEQSQGKMKMTIVTSTGEDRDFVYETSSKNHGEKTLLKYIEPTRLKGQAILLKNNANDIWTYFPRTKRIRKLATHARKQKLEGSDFSYEDMGASNTFIEEYNAVRLNDEKKEHHLCYKIELTPKSKSSADYSKIIAWVDKKSFVPVVIDYFHKKYIELLEKELICRDIRAIDGIFTPMKFVMYNKLDNTQTSMEILNITYNIKLSDDLFTEMGMQQ